MTEATTVQTAAPSAAPTQAPAPAAAAPAAPHVETTATTHAEPPAPAPAPAAPKWGDTWRDDIVGNLPDTATDEEKGEHDKLAKLVKRYNTPADMAKALRAAQVKISDGSLKAALPKNATSEQITEWRKENGIPEAPDKYELGLPAGVVLGDGDKALLDSWVTKVHGVNASPDVVKAGAAALIEVRDKQVQAISDKDGADKSAIEDTFREEWGSDYRANIGGIDSMLSHADKSVRDAVMNARGPDGTALANNPAVLRWLSGHARELGFVGSTVVPAGGDLGKTIDDELGALKAEMGKDIDAWRKNTKGQARYMQLVDAKTRMDSRK